MRLVAQPRQWRTGQCIEGTAAGAAAIALQAMDMAVAIMFSGMAMRAGERLRRLLDDEYKLESGCRLQQCQQVRTLAPCQTAVLA